MKAILKRKTFTELRTNDTQKAEVGAATKFLKPLLAAHASFANQNSYRLCDTYYTILIKILITAILIIRYLLRYLLLRYLLRANTYYERERSDRVVSTRVH